MSDIIGTLRFSLAGADKVQFVWLGAILLTIAILAVLHHKWRYYDGQLKQWKKLCFIPFIISMLHFIIYTAPHLLQNYTPMYLISLLPLITALCAERDKGYRKVAPIIWVLTAVFGLRFISAASDIHNYSRKSYSDSFHSLVKKMDKRYVLKEWKEIDFFALEDKYMPMVKKAEQEKDPAMFADAVTLFCNELHDGHVSVHSYYDKSKYHSAFEPNDYGMAMIQLDSGEVIAVCTDEAIHSLGITDGTVITKWNGKPLSQAVQEDVIYDDEAVKANADKLAFIELSGMGGDTVEVSFIGSDGKEKSAVLSAMENGDTYGDALDALDHFPEDIRELYSANFSTKMLDDKCGCLVLSAEFTGGSLRDDLDFYKGESKWSREMFRKKLRKLKAQGMEYLVVDMRNNGGGSGVVGYALCSLLTNEDMFAAGLGMRKNGEYVQLAEQRIKGDGEFADLNVVVLTNHNCVSAGDSTALCLSKLPNVTLAGITDPNGSAQITGGRCFLSKALVSVSFPVCLMLNENGEPDIDPRADRISRDPCEVRIPLDRDAAMKIFRDKEDYELEWAVKYLEQ